MNAKKLTRNPLIYVLLIGVLLIAGFILINSLGGPKQITTQEGFELLDKGAATEVMITDGNQRVDMHLSEAYEGAEDVQFYYVSARADDLVDAVERAAPADGYDDDVPQQSIFGSLLTFLIPVLLLGLLFWFLLANAQGGGRMAQFGKSKAKLANKEHPDVTFVDVAGADEALEELQEIKDFLADRSKYQAVGARSRRASCSTARPAQARRCWPVRSPVRQAFRSIRSPVRTSWRCSSASAHPRPRPVHQAKENGPAIIFIDEIDAVGRQRGAGMGGGHDEREQTLNQMLVEMDGSTRGQRHRHRRDEPSGHPRPRAASPRPLRPPDRRRVARTSQAATRSSRCTAEASRSPPASIWQLRRAEALRASRAPTWRTCSTRPRCSRRAPTSSDRPPCLDEAIDRVIGGPQRRTRVMKDKERLITAYHEGGHALAAAAMNFSDPVTKITILPRGKALGYTMVLPLEDKFSITRNELQDQLTYAMGGRVAEEIVFHDPTTGAANDIEKATGPPARW